MSVKSAPGMTSKAASKPPDDPEIQVAKISSSTTIQVTKAQVIGTIIAAVLTLFGVAIANLDKFSRSAPTPPVNKLHVESNVKRVREVIESNQQDAQSAQTILLGKETAQKETVKRFLSGYKHESEQRMERFDKEKAILDKAVESDNQQVINDQKQRLYQLGIEDSSALEHTFNQIDRTLHLFDTDQKEKPIETSDERLLEELFKKKRVDSLAKLLPIKRDRALKRTELLFNGETPPYYDLPYFKNYSENNLHSGVIPPSDTVCAENGFRQFPLAQAAVPSTEQPFIFRTTLRPLSFLGKNLDSTTVEAGTVNDSECSAGLLYCVPVKQETTLKGEYRLYLGSVTVQPAPSGVQQNFLYGLSEPPVLNESKITSDGVQCLAEEANRNFLFNQPKSAPIDEPKNTFRLSVRYTF